LVDERSDDVHLGYDKVAGFLAAYGNAKALAVARDLDGKIGKLYEQQLIKYGRTATSAVRPYSTTKAQV
jgi:hypothetical protein